LAAFERQLQRCRQWGREAGHRGFCLAETFGCRGVVRGFPGALQSRDHPFPVTPHLPSAKLPSLRGNSTILSPYHSAPVHVGGHPYAESVFRDCSTALVLDLHRDLYRLPELGLELCPPN
jgi:hypothetical protein